MTPNSSVRPLATRLLAAALVAAAAATLIADVVLIPFQFGLR